MGSARLMPDLPDPGPWQQGLCPAYQLDPVLLSLGVRMPCDTGAGCAPAPHHRRGSTAHGEMSQWQKPVLGVSTR